jgi:phenylpyruvate tautomerase PptA (4-oxalocrotonate tautomerase family)
MVVMFVPVVHVNVWSGISLENKKKIVEGITKVLEDIGIPSQAITVIISEELRRTGLQAANCILKRLQTVDDHLIARFYENSKVASARAKTQ